MNYGFGETKSEVAGNDPHQSEAARLLSDFNAHQKGQNRFCYGIDLKTIPPALVILESPPEVQRCVVRQLIDLFIEGEKRRLHYAGHNTRVQLMWRLIRRKLPLTDEDLVLCIQFCQTQGLDGMGYVVGACERYASVTGLTDSLARALHDLRNAGQNNSHDKQVRKQVDRISELLGEEVVVQVHCDTDEILGKRILDDVGQLEDETRDAMLALLIHASGVNGGKPTQKWLKQAGELIESLDPKLLNAALTVWCHAFDQPRPQPFHGYPQSVWFVSDINSDLLKGLLWMTPRFADDGLIRAISRAGISGQRKVPEVGPRCHKVTNAAVWALGQIDKPLAIGQLAILKSRVKNKAVQKQIDKAMHAAAQRLGVSPQEVEEMAVPTYGLTDVGVRLEPMGEFTAELVITGTGTTGLGWIKPGGKIQKTVPKSVKEAFADELKELKAAAKDIQRILPSQRDRIDQLHLQQKCWSYPVWEERYINHVLIGSLARRMIWEFDLGEGKDKVAAAWLDGALVDSAGDPVAVDLTKSMVMIWHPIGKDQTDVLAWRTFFETREIKQPIKQAHREVYLLTDAERNTEVYSNRFAAHLIKQHQFNALCGVRGWKNQLRLMVDDEYPPATLELPEWGLRAEFWIEGAGDDYQRDVNQAGSYLYLATDQVRFYSMSEKQVSAHATGGGYGGLNLPGEVEPEPMPLEDVPLLVFSEVMRDVDLFVGVASVGNDPAWEDGGRLQRYGHEGYWGNYSFGDLSGTAKSRKELLERLIPRLKIAERCSFDDRFLIVNGDVRTYKIHLGSGNILMEPNDQYLCIVPGGIAANTASSKVFLPFEGDRTLSIILSKAFMLAEDTKITDRTILSQIRN